MKTTKERDVFFAPLSYTDRNSAALLSLKAFGNALMRIKKAAVNNARPKPASGLCPVSI
jgi:hypothetical protein